MGLNLDLLAEVTICCFVALCQLYLCVCVFACYKLSYGVARL